MRYRAPGRPMDALSAYLQTERIELLDERLARYGRQLATTVAKLDQAKQERRDLRAEVDGLTRPSPTTAAAGSNSCGRRSTATPPTATGVGSARRLLTEWLATVGLDPVTDHESFLTTTAALVVELRASLQSEDGRPHQRTDPALR